MAGYSRQSVADIIANAVIKAAPVNAEFNAIRDAFSFSVGHKHDGSSTEGAYIPLIADVDGNNKVVVDTANNRVSFYIEVSGSPVEQLRIQDGVVVPVTTNDIDLGAVGAEFKDVYIDGIGYIDTIQVHENATIAGSLTVAGATTLQGNTTLGDTTTDTVTVTAGVASDVLPSVDGTYDLGSSTKEWQDIFIDGTAKIDTLTVDENATVAGTLGVTGTTTATTLNVTTGLTATTADINGGTIDGADIGVTSRGAGNFTTVNSNAGITGNLTGNVTGAVTGNVTGNLTGNVTSAGTSTFTTVDINGGAIDGTAIGAASASTVRGTTITATTGFVGPITGAVTGNVTGNLTGNVTASTGTTTLNNLTVNGAIDVTNAVVQNVATPTIGTDAANKSYVDAQIAATIDAAPGTLDTLNELAAALGDDPNFATTVSNSIATKVSKAGDSMTGNLSMGGNKVTGLADPTVGTDAVTKNYVDTVYGSVSSAAVSATAAANSASAAEADRILVQSVYDTFDDRYLGAKASDPATDNDGNALITGALYFDTSNNITKVYNGSEWQAASSSIEGIKQDFLYVATAAQTVFSGADSNGNTLVVDQVGLVAVYMNGVRLIKDTDYTVSAPSNSVTLTSGAASGDRIEVEVFGNFAGQSGAAVAITGGSITGLSALGVAGNATFGDNNKAIFGAGSDLQIYHDGAASYILGANTGDLVIEGTNLRLRAVDNTNYFRGVDGVATYLFHPDAINDIKLTTTSTGVDVTGTVTADGLQVTNTATTGTNQEVASFRTASGGGLVIRSSDLSSANPDSILEPFFGESLKIKTSGNDRFKIQDNGDISFYEDTGTTPKFFWDASAESLGIGCEPRTRLEIASGNSGGDAGLDAPVFRITNTTPSSDWDSGDVNGTIEFYVDDTSGNAPYDTAFIQSVNDINNGTLPSGALVFGTATYNAVGGAVERMRIDSNGNVGIGTSSPASYAGFTTLNIKGSGVSTGGVIQLDTSDASKSATMYVDAVGLRLGAVTSHSVTFHTNDTERMRITSTGNVGIGTSNPTARLHVSFSAASYDDQLRLRNTDTGTGGYAVATFAQSAAGSAVGIIGTGASAASNSAFRNTFAIGTQSNHSFTMLTNDTERLRIDASGSLLVGTTIAPGSSGSVGLRKGGTGQLILIADNGGLYHQALGSYYLVTTAGGSTSDATLKTNVTTLTGALGKVCAMRGVNFEFIEPQKSTPDNGVQIGVIAQEVEAQYPEAVVTNDDGIKSVRYEKLVAPLIEAIKEQQEIIASLKARLDAANL